MVPRKWDAHSTRETRTRAPSLQQTQCLARSRWRTPRRPRARTRFGIMSGPAGANLAPPPETPVVHSRSLQMTASTTLPAAGRLLELVDAMAGQPVLMLVDLVADRFISGTPKRISREAPVLILTYQGER